MLTMREQWLKWSLYALLIGALTLLSLLLPGDTRLFGVRFFLPPLFVGVVASMESPRAGMLFAVVYGALCDLTLAGLFPCVHTIAFALAAPLCAALAQNLLQPGAACSLLSSLLVFAVLDALNMLALAVNSRAALPAGLSLACREALVSSLLLLAVHPPLAWLHRRFTLYQ